MGELLAITCDVCGGPMVPNISTLDEDGCGWICIDPDCPDCAAEQLEACDLIESGVPEYLAGRLARLIDVYEEQRTREWGSGACGHTAGRIACGYVSDSGVCGRGVAQSARSHTVDQAARSQGQAGGRGVTLSASSHAACEAASFPDRAACSQGQAGAPEDRATAQEVQLSSAPAQPSSVPARRWPSAPRHEQYVVAALGERLRAASAACRQAGELAAALDRDLVVDYASWVCEAGPAAKQSLAVRAPRTATIGRARAAAPTRAADIDPAFPGLLAADDL